MSSDGPEAHNLEETSFMYSCQGVFTDNFIFGTILARKSLKPVSKIYLLPQHRIFTDQ